MEKSLSRRGLLKVGLLAAALAALPAKEASDQNNPNKLKERPVGEPRQVGERWTGPDGNERARMRVIIERGGKKYPVEVDVCFTPEGPRMCPDQPNLKKE